MALLAALAMLLIDCIVAVAITDIYLEFLLRDELDRLIKEY
jgi:hypothetical protein